MQQPIDQKLVMAHVYGHCDFFKNNLYFAHTSRKMMDEMANHATRIQRYADRYGIQAVEAFIDCCLSLENLIDPHAPFIKRRDQEGRGDRLTPPTPPNRWQEGCACGGKEPAPPAAAAAPRAAAGEKMESRKPISSPTARKRIESCRAVFTARVTWTLTSTLPSF